MGHGDHSDPYRRPFEAILDGAVIIDATTGRILVANKAAAAIFNFPSPEEMVGINPLDHIPDEDRGFIAILLAQGLEMDRPAPAEIRLRVKDGRLIWVSVTSALTEHENKRATLLSLREITPEKAKETAMRGAERLYQHLFDTMLDGAVVLDAASALVVLANQAAARIFGFASPLEMVGRNPLEHVPPEDQQRVAQLMSDSFTSNLGSPVQLRLVTKDKRVVWISARGNLIEIEGKKVTLTIIRDITSEKVQDAALREAEQQYEGLFDGMLDGALVLDVSTFEIVLANKAVAEMFGFESPREVIGENPLSYIPEEDRDNVARMIALNLEGKGQNPAEIRVVTKDRRNLWISATATRVDYEGRTATLTTLRDITADKAKDAALLAAEESRLQLMDASSEGITIVQDGKLVYVNSAIAQGAGIPREQLMGLAFLDLIHPDERQAVWQRYERIMAGEWFSEIATMRGLNVKGETLWAEVREIPFTWQGRPAVMSLIHDITARMRLEEERKEREERFRAIIENAWDGITILDENYSVIYESPSLARITGYTPEEWMGRPVGQMNIHPDDLAPLLAKIETLKSQPGSVITDVKIRYQRKDGSWRWIEATGRNLLHDPKVKGLVVNFRDITDKVLAEEERKEKEESLHAIVENAWDGVIILDDNYGVLFESPALSRMTGYTPQEWKGRSPAEWPIHPDDLDSILKRLDDLRSQPGATISGIRMRLRHKDGSWRTLEATGRNLLQDPKVKGLVANFRDVTDNVKAEEALKVSEERFRTLIERATDVVIVMDATGKITYQSPSLERVTGFGYNEWLDRSLGELLIHPDDMPALASLLERILTQPGATVEGVTARYQHKDGSWHTLEATVTNMLHDPSVNGLVANFRDITDRKQAAEALERSEALLRDTETLTGAGGWEYNVETGSMTWTDETYRIHEIPNVPTIDHVAESLKCYPPPARQVIEEAFQKCVQEGIPYDLELPFVTFGGNRRWMRTTAKAMREDNRIVRVLGNIADVTAHKDAELALGASEERNRLLIDSAAEVVTVVQEGSITFINRKCFDLCGYTPEELVSRQFLELIHPEDRQMLADNYVRRLSGEDVPAVYEFRVLHQNGSIRWAAASVTLFTWNGSPATLGLLTDITSRKQAEEALEKSEERYRTFAENASDALWIMDMNFNLTYHSGGGRIFGYTAEEMLKRPVDQRMPPESVQTAFKILQGELAIEELPDKDLNRKRVLELAQYHKDGSIIHTEETVSFLRDEKGKAIGITGVTRDITDRKRAEYALRESEAKYRHLFESTQTAMEVIDMETGLVALANEATARMFGFASADDLVGIDSTKYLRPEDVGWVAEKMAQAVADSSWREIAELQVRTNDGRWLWISGMVIQSEYLGKPALLVSLLDITSRKQAEETLRESEEKYRRLTEKTNDIIYTTDLDFNDTYVSPSVEKILGFTPEEHLARSPDEQMTLESLARAQEALLGHLALEKDPQADPNRTLRIELEYYHRDGSTVWLEHQVSALRDADGMVIGLHGVARDVTERRGAERAIRESEEKYRLLAEKTNDVVWTTDLNLHTTYVSPSVERVLGFTPEERLRQDAVEQMTPESLARAAEALAQHLALEKDPTADPSRTLRIELEYCRKDGSTGWLENQVSGIRDADGTLVGFHGVARDVTERRKAEQLIRESEGKYRLLTEKTSDLIYTTDLNFRNVYVSPSVERVLGFTPEEHMERDAAQQMTPESLARAGEALREQLALEQDPKADPNRTVRIDLECYRKDGSTVWLEQHVNFIRDDSGTVVGLHGGARDISERRRAEQALKESEAKYRLVAESTNDEIWTSDMNLNTTYVSPSVEKLLGFTVEERMKQDVMAQMTPESFARAAEALKHHLALEEDPEADPNRVLRIELEYYRKDGSTIWLENQVSGIRDVSGKLVGLHGVARDVTERRQMVQTLRERLKELQCIAGVSRLAEKPDLPIEYFVRDAVSLLPPAWKYPEVCGACVQFDSKEFKTANYRETEWSQSADIMVDEKRFGTVTVCYLEERPVADEGPFSKEERALIDTIADFLGHVIQHRQMEKYLHASEERYRLLAENASDIIWVIDANRHITDVSPSAASLLGYSLEELMTGSLDKALTPESLASVAQLYMDDLAGENVTPGSIGERVVEIEAVCKDGSTVWLEAVTKPIRDADGQMSGFQGACRNITRRKMAEESMQASEIKYRDLFDHTLLGTEVIDAETGKVVLTNHSIASMFGFKSPEDMIGTNPMDYVLPEDKEWVVQQMAQVFADPQKHDVVNIRARTEDGRIIWVTGSGTSFQHQGKWSMLLSLIDMTAAKEAEFRLLESEEKNRLLIEVADEGIAVVQDGVTRFFNRRLEELTGWSSEELLSRSFLDLVHPTTAKWWR